MANVDRTRGECRIIAPCPSRCRQPTLLLLRATSMFFFFTQTIQKISFERKENKNHGISCVGNSDENWTAWTPSKKEDEVVGG
jgi:hypothetical protein